MRRKWASFFRDELRQEIGLADGDKFLHLLFGNFAVQNHLAYSKTARLRRADRVFASVRPLENINLPFLAHRTQAKRFVPRSVDLLLGIDSLLAKIKFLFEIAVQLHGGAEFATNLAAKSFQRTDATLGQKFFNLGSLEQTARHRFPNDQAARSTFERAVILIEWTTAAFRTFHLQRLEIAADGVAFEVFRFLDNLARELSDLRHEFLALHVTFGHALEFIFPLAGHFGRAYLGDANAAEKRDQRHPFRACRVT